MNGASALAVQRTPAHIGQDIKPSLIVFVERDALQQPPSHQCASVTGNGRVCNRESAGNFQLQTQARYDTLSVSCNLSIG